MADDDAHEWDVVVVGSGAGGATLAARLVESGLRVCVLEAGSDAKAAAAPGLPDDYDVPGFHAFACENPAMSWSFQVRHYADETQQLRDPKYRPGDGGVLYPRAATLGGCTAHNAMIYMPPHDGDWDHVAEVGGDASWRAPHMRRFARRVESCRHRPLWRALRRTGIDPTGHGWDGWLNVEKAVPLEALGDPQMRALVAETGRGFVRSLPHPLFSTLRWLRGRGDPNARPWGGGSFTGLCYLPLATKQQRRQGARERLLQAAAAHPGRLHIELDALATRVLFDADGAATGVEYLKGARLYRAHAAPSPSAGERRVVRARREVVLAGGAFNTPQLLMLSGIGPAAQLRAHGIAARVDLPGVGCNLQDRYEVAVTHRLSRPWRLLEGAEFRRGDALWQRWQADGGGMYGSNGASLGIVLRSDPGVPEPDLFCMALPAHFDGYHPGFSNAIRAHPDRLSWVVLKAHTRNRAGCVELRSADPRDPPRIDFGCFDAGDDPGAEDLRAVVDAIERVRALSAPLRASGVIAEELAPGPQVQGPQALAAYVRDTAWGHHASCSCPIGPPERGGVLDARFAVHGTRRLRVVDASVFPRIPGIFIVSAVYIAAEKAAETMLQDWQGA